MEIQKYIDQKKQLYDALLLFLDNTDNTDYNFNELIKLFEAQEIQGNSMELKYFLLLISNIFSNHYKSQGFTEKIQRIILHLQDKIKKSFSNIEIFNFFMENKSIILFLFEKKIIIVDEAIKDKLNEPECRLFFYPEIKQFNSKKKNQKIEQELLHIDPNILENFDKKRQIGENDSYICSLIRQDSVEEFVQMTNKQPISLKSKVPNSLFETNSFLSYEKVPTLIEYAAFFGSFQILQYLNLNGVDIEPTLWLYAVHGNNPEVIHFLEQNLVDTQDLDYINVFQEAIKCHHNEIANYIEDNKIDFNEIDKKEFEEEVVEIIFCYHDWAFFPEDFEQFYVYEYLTEYNYENIVQFLLKIKEEEIKSSTV